MRCDCHVHIVGPQDRYPQVATRSYTAGPAPLADLVPRAVKHGVGRFVIVQPSFYGSDNTVLLESLEQLGPHGRGVVVLEPKQATEDETERLDELGVRGVRINLYSPMNEARSGAFARDFAAQVEIASEYGWHVEVIAPLERLLSQTDALARSQVPVVLDHYGLTGQVNPETAQGRRLVELVRQPHAWMKLSAPYRTSTDPLATSPDADWLSALVEAAPTRCVWGSDWPHTPQHEANTGAQQQVPYRAIDYGELLGDFVAAVDTPAMAARILGDNAARLYGFEED